MLRIIRSTAWGVAAAMVATFAFAYFYGFDRLIGLERPPVVDGMPRIGQFQLTTHEGKLFTSNDLKSKPAAVFFGFTHCPDVCPTSLMELTEILKQLGPDAAKLNVLFVAVDAERDTREQVALYLQSFDPRIIGLTGVKGEIDAAVKAFNAFYEKVSTKDGDYAINHTASVVLVDSQARFAGTLDYHEALESKLAKVRRLAARS